MSSKPSGRPTQPIQDGEDARPHLRLPPETLRRLEAAAAKARRSVGAEIAVALEAYLDAHPRPPAVPEPDVAHERTRRRLPPELVQRLDALVGLDARERYLIAAVVWWVGG